MSYRDLKHPTSRKNFAAVVGQNHALILTQCLKRIGTEIFSLYSKRHPVVIWSSGSSWDEPGVLTQFLMPCSWLVCNLHSQCEFHMLSVNVKCIQSSKNLHWRHPVCSSSNQLEKWTWGAHYSLMTHYSLGMGMRMRIHAVHADMRIAYRGKKYNISSSHSSLYLWRNVCSWIGSSSWISFSPVWMRKWALKSPLSWFVFLHCVHLCDFSPLWVSIWFFRIPFQPMIFHTRNKGGASPQCA